MTRVLFVMSLLSINVGCALLRSAEDEQRINTQKQYMHEREEAKQEELRRKQEKAAQAEADRLAMEKYLAENPPDERALDDICGTSADLFRYALTLDDEQKIGRGSGAYDLSAANELGYKILHINRELKNQIASFKSNFKKEPDVDRCTYVNGLPVADQQRAYKIIRRFDGK